MSLNLSTLGLMEASAAVRNGVQVRMVVPFGRYEAATKPRPDPGTLRGHEIGIIIY